MVNSKMLSFTKSFFSEVGQISNQIDHARIELLADKLSNLKKNNGRLFICGVGGSAGNASHAVNDFRKLCEIETYAPTDNISELTARTNDEGWESVFIEWLKISKLNKKDSILIFSVGGGDKLKNVSTNLIKCINLAKKREVPVYAILGKNNGYASKHADIAIIVPEVNSKLITPYSESFQTIIWHCLVSHPKLQTTKTKW